jgi:hypothetical protein
MTDPETNVEAEGAEPKVTLVSSPDVSLTSKFVVNGTLSPCCSVPGNLGEEHKGRSPNTTLPYDLVYRVCKNCQRRHFRVKAEGDAKVRREPKLVMCGGCGILVFMTQVGCPVCYNKRIVIANSL